MQTQNMEVRLRSGSRNPIDRGTSRQLDHEEVRNPNYIPRNPSRGGANPGVYSATLTVTRCVTQCLPDYITASMRRAPRKWFTAILVGIGAGIGTIGGIAIGLHISSGKQENDGMNGVQFPPQIQGETSNVTVQNCKKFLSYFKEDDPHHDESWIFKKQMNHNFVSQEGQDWLLYATMFRNMPRQGIYIDLAAHHPKSISNTFFLDKCLGWRGLCIEADPGLVQLLRQQRSCKVVDTCIWKEPTEMTFMVANGHGMAGLEDQNKLNNKGTPTKMMCSTIQIEMDKVNMDHVDLLSLDIEGAEYDALKGVDFSRVQIDVILVETGMTGSESEDEKDKMERIGALLKSKGYLDMTPYGIKTKFDTLYIHGAATDKLKYIDQWLEDRKSTPWKDDPISK